MFILRTALKTTKLCLSREATFSLQEGWPCKRGITAVYFVCFCFVESFCLIVQMQMMMMTTMMMEALEEV